MVVQHAHIIRTVPTFKSNISVSLRSNLYCISPGLISPSQRSLQQPALHACHTLYGGHEFRLMLFFPTIVAPPTTIVHNECVCSAMFEDQPLFVCMISAPPMTFVHSIGSKTIVLIVFLHLFRLGWMTDFSLSMKAVSGSYMCINPCSVASMLGFPRALS